MRRSRSSDFSQPTAFALVAFIRCWSRASLTASNVSPALPEPSARSSWLMPTMRYSIVLPLVNLTENFVPASIATLAFAYAGDASPFAAMSSATALCSSRVQSFGSLATAVWTVAESAPVEPPPDAPPSAPPVVPVFTVLPTRLNWLRMAPATPGPANTITRPMTAMIRTYSMIDCPRRRVPLGDTPPPEG